jgi:hypothetical protein
MEAILYFSSKYLYLQNFTIWGFTKYLNVILSKHDYFSNISLNLEFNLKTRKLIICITLIVMGANSIFSYKCFVLKIHQTVLSGLLKHLDRISNVLQNLKSTKN